jgi:hypothetical protein
MSTPYADDDPFVAPASGGNLGAIEGRLLLAYPSEQGKSKSKYPTHDGTGLVQHVVCKVVVLDGDEPGKVMERVKILSGSMVPQLLPYVGTGKPVLGRLGKDKFENGMGWVLNEASEPEMDTARKWIAANPVKRPVDPFATVG